MDEFNIEEIKKLREEVEGLRRDIARLNGRLDVTESNLGLLSQLVDVYNRTPSVNIVSDPAMTVGDILDLMAIRRRGVDLARPKNFISIVEAKRDDD